MSRANAKPLCQCVDTGIIERGFVDEAHCPFNCSKRSFPGRRERRGLGPAAQTRSIPGGLGGRG
jgi:hypothetical protein